MDLLQGLTFQSVNHLNGPPEKEEGGKEEPPQISPISSLSKKSEESSLNCNQIPDEVPIVCNGNAEVQSFSVCNGHQEEGQCQETSPDLQPSPRSSPTKQKPPVVSKKPHISSLPPYSLQKLNGRVLSLEEEPRRPSEKIPYQEEEFTRPLEKVLSLAEESRRPSEKIPYQEEEFTRALEKVDFEGEDSSRSSEKEEEPKTLSELSEVDWKEDVQTEVCTNGDAHEDDNDEDEEEEADRCSSTSESTDSKEDEAGESGFQSQLFRFQPCREEN